MLCSTCNAPKRILGKANNKEFVGIEQCINKNCKENKPRKIKIGNIAKIIRNLG